MYILVVLVVHDMSAQTYVNVNADSGGNGNSWATAYNNLQTAINNSSNGTEVWVASGRYLTTATSDRNISFTMKEGVSLYGGFIGTEVSLEQRDIKANRTILSGEIGDTTDFSDNSYHVIRNKENGISTNTELDGFIVSDGNASDPEPNERGGGMFNKGASPTIRNCTFINNGAQFGAGIYNLGGSNPVIRDCRIIQNEASEVCGGIYNFLNCNPKVYNCIIAGNLANGELSGALYNFLSTAEYTNCLISGNEAKLGATCYNTNGSLARFINCTVVGNSASELCSGIYNVNSDTEIINSIFWYNRNLDIPEDQLIINTLNSTSIVRYSLIENLNISDGQNLAGLNSDNAPIFIDPIDYELAPNSDGDYRLQRITSVVDAGDAIFNNEQFDLEGKERIINGSIDLGCYEFSNLTSSSISHPIVKTLIFPNPCEQYITLKSTEPITTIVIHDSSGKKLILKTGLAKSTYKLNLDQLVPGMYFMEILMSKEKQVKKIVKL